jgi:hypothetical protein
MRNIHKIIIGSALVAGTFLAIDYFYNRKREEEEEERMFQEKLDNIRISFTQDLMKRSAEIQKGAIAAFDKTVTEIEKKLDETQEQKPQ